MGLGIYIYIYIYLFCKENRHEKQQVMSIDGYEYEHIAMTIDP